jgi:excisionase family DNA binding protein
VSNGRTPDRTAPALAKALGVSKATVYKWRESGLRTIKLGNTVLFHEESVVQWLKSKETTESPQE